MSPLQHDCLGLPQDSDPDSQPSLEELEKELERMSHASTSGSMSESTNWFPGKVWDVDSLDVTTARNPSTLGSWGSSLAAFAMLLYNRDLGKGCKFCGGVAIHQKGCAMMKPVRRPR